MTMDQEIFLEIKLPEINLTLFFVAVHAVLTGVTADLTIIFLCLRGQARAAVRMFFHTNIDTKFACGRDSTQGKIGTVRKIEFECLGWRQCRFTVRSINQPPGID